MIGTAAPHGQGAVVRAASRDYTSFSALNLYRQCPLRYYFKYVAGLPERTVSASLVFGSAIHAAVELHFNELLAGNPPPDLDDLLTAYRLSWQTRAEVDVQFGKEDNQNGLENLAWRMLTAFQHSDLAQPAGTIIGIEEELRGELIPGAPDLLARVDLLIDAGDALVVTDFKTARSRWGRDQADDQAEQLLLYGELAQRLAPHKSVRLEFAVLTKTKDPSIDRHVVASNPARIDRTRRVFGRVWQAIEAEHFYPAPSPMNCPTCPFRVPCGAWSG